jgi:multidrug efflux pump subunit AcrA (membrane-fusion protein)
VTVVFQGDPSKFFVGASVIANIVTSSTGDVLQVPFRAVTVAADGSSTVLVSTDGKATDTKTVTVTTGTIAGGVIEIKTGLKDGDQVVVAARGAGGGNFPGQGTTAGNGGTGTGGNNDRPSGNQTSGTGR